MNIADFAARNARSRGNEIAISDDCGDLTHRALDERVRRTAAALVRRGIAPGDVVAICLKDGGRTVVLWLALARIGAPFITMDWRWTPEEQLQLGRVLRPKLVFVEPDRKVAGSLPIIRHDTAWVREVDSMSAENRMAPGGDMAFIINLTSGTTGLPKGHVHSHGTYAHMTRSFYLDMGQRPGDRVLSVLPLASAAGRASAIATVIYGGTLYFTPPLLEAHELAALIRDHRIDVVCVVPTILRSLLAEATGPGVLLPELRLLLSVGAMLFPEESLMIRKRVAQNLVNYYGSTGGGINTMLYPGELDLKPGSVGRAAFGNQLEIVDDAGRTLPAGETGRLRVRSHGTCWGDYPPDPDNSSYFEGWHYPGDYALIDEHGYLFLQGRYNDIIIRSGSNVYAPEVERVLLACGGVSEAAVIGVPNPLRDEDVVAFVVADETLSDSAIMRHCRSNLAAYKVPSQIHRRMKLPRSSVGKILKRKLLETSAAD